MEEDQQNQNKNEKPRYYATDFNEIMKNLSDEEKLLFERYKEMLSGGCVISLWRTLFYVIYCIILEVS